MVALGHAAMRVDQALHAAHWPCSFAGLNKYSSRITQPKSQGASQAMLYATGLKEGDMNKPQVGISSVWYEGNPCNMHLMQLAEEVKRGVEDIGMVGYRFNTIGVSDGISMGTDGMSFSLQSRDLIADSIETVMSAQWYDANISLPGACKACAVQRAQHAVAHCPSCARNHTRSLSRVLSQAATRTCLAPSWPWRASTAPRS
jgi:dihydroxyacid dehydratase/phosphogluconate dehydratase